MIPLISLDNTPPNDSKPIRLLSHPASGCTRVALYARVSSEQQSAAGTIDSQVALLKERLGADGLTLEPQMDFIDDGYSGTTLIRPALERLRDAAASGVVDRLYITCPDRLARKCSLQMVLIEELERCGVELVFLNRPVGGTDRSPEDELLLQVQGVVAEYERAKILERSRRGKLHAARSGSVSVIGRAPYGYRYVAAVPSHGGLPPSAAQFNVHLEEAQVVRQMFHWVGVEHASIRQVCRNLQKQGILNVKGLPRWAEHTVADMLHNPAYKGMAAYGRIRGGPMRPRPRPARGHREQPRRARGWYRTPGQEWISIPVPAIVEEELFDTVARQLEQNRTRMRQRRMGASHLLQGLLACSRCGYAYVGVRSRRQVKKVTYAYRCYCCTGACRARARAAGREACPSRRLHADRLEEAVWNDVCSLLQDPQRMEQEFQRRLKGFKRCEPGGDSSQSFQSPQHLRAAAAAHSLRQGMNRLIDAYQNGLIDKTQFEPRMTDARTRLARLQAEIKSQADAESALQEMRLVIDDFQQFAQRIQTGLAEADWTTRRDLIRMLIKRIDISDQEVQLTYKVPIRPFDQAAPGGIREHCALRVGAAPWRCAQCFKQRAFGRV